MKDLSVRLTEELVRKLQQGITENKTTKEKIDSNVLRLQGELSDKIGAMVKIQHSKKGKGKVTIHYHSLDELDGILERIR